MNEVLKVIKERRTTRKYNEEQIKDTELNEIVEAGLFAPSGHNQQPWHFTVVQNKELLNEISEATKEVGRNSPVDAIRNLSNNDKLQIFYNAPTVIFVSGDDKAMTGHDDCSAAIQNMLLAAESLDIGSCWSGFVSFLFGSDKLEEYKKKLNIPQGYTPYYGVCLGYKGVKLTNAPARKENTVTYIK